MGQTVWQDKKILILNRSGFTLIEVMIAFVIILIVMLGLLNLTGQVVTVSVKNTVRDEAIKVAEEVMAQVKALPYDDISTMTYNQLRKKIDPNSSASNITRNFRNFYMTYTPEISVITYSNAKVINVTVTWSYRWDNYSHVISSLVRRTE